MVHYSSLQCHVIWVCGLHIVCLFVYKVYKACTYFEVCLYVFDRGKDCNLPSDIGESLHLAAVLVVVSDTGREMGRDGEDLRTGGETFRNK